MCISLFNGTVANAQGVLPSEEETKQTTSVYILDAEGNVLGEVESASPRSVIIGTTIFLTAYANAVGIVYTAAGWVTMHPELTQSMVETAIAFFETLQNQFGPIIEGYFNGSRYTKFVTEDGSECQQRVPGANWVCKYSL